MKSEHIDIAMKPDIIVKASPEFQQIDAKAVAGVAAEDIIERNVIAEYRDTDEDVEPEGDEEATDVQ